VTIVRDYEDVPLINVDKHKVLQILVNVIRNAKYACQENEKRVTVRIRATDASMLISVIDTGLQRFGDATASGIALLHRDDFLDVLTLLRSADNSAIEVSRSLTRSSASSRR